MESNYFEKIQKRYDELTDKGASLEYGKMYWLSLKRELPNVPEDTYCTDRFMVRLEDAPVGKSIEYRRYDDETGKWSDWKSHSFEYSDFMEDVTLRGKEIYILNMEDDNKCYDFRHLTFYAPELSQKTFVLKNDESKKIKIFPWVYIDVDISTADDGFIHDYSPVEARICTWHKTSGDYEDAKRYFAETLVDGYHEVYQIDRGDADSHPKIVKEVEDLLDDGQLPAKILNAKIYGNYDNVMFTPAQGLKFADERLPILQQKLKEITPEWKQLKAILAMSPEEKAQYIAQEKKKEQEEKKKKAAERAEKKKLKEEEDKKKSKLSTISFFVLLASLAIAALPLMLSEEIDFLDEHTFLTYIIAIAIFVGLRYAWHPIKKNLRKKYGIKDEE